MKIDRIKKYYALVFLVIVIAIAILTVTIVENATRSYIETRQDQETLDELQNVFPEMSFYNFEEQAEIYHIYDANRSQIGYAFYGSGYGWGGKMVVLIGLQDKEKIKDIFIVSHREPIYWWNKLVYSDYFDQFTGLKIEDCMLKRYGDGQVDAATGATVSSKAVADIVRKTSLEKISFIR